MTVSPNTPFIAFNPALSLQRQTLLLQTLRELRPKSVFDVGCGEGRLLECLCRCDEALPVELLAGIDMSLQVLQDASQSVQTSGDDQQIDGRWSPLDITLLHGRFSELGPEAAVFEAVTSSEVIEHLDPPDLDRFWDVHLGTLKPNLLVVTTPNRDFNVLFETIIEFGMMTTVSSTPDSNLKTCISQLRERVFDIRCYLAAKEFGYEVSFAGVGTARNALSRISELFNEHKEFHSLGYATQVAVFKRKPPRLIISSSAPQWGQQLQVFTHLSYERNIFTPYPPDPDVIASSLGAMWRQFRPEYSSRRDKIEPSSWAEAFGATHLEKAGVLTCQFAVEKLWGMDYSLSKLCRFNDRLFFALTEKLDGRVFEREFVGLEVSRSSLRSFRFAKIEGKMYILYEYPIEYPETRKIRDFGRASSVSSEEQGI